MTLQEYLVKLGFSVDEPGFKKFIGAVSSAGARTAELGTAAIETAIAVELMVSRVARGYETLYYMSQRTGQSVAYIQKTQFAFKQIGLSAEDANASIEGIATTLRTQPWLRAIFGNASTPQQVATNLGRSGLPYFLQVKFAEMIGLSERTLFQMQKFGDVEAKAQADFAKRQKEAGIDPDKLAKQSVDYGRALNKLESDLDIFGERMAADLIGPTQKGIELFDEVVQWLNRVDSATHGWAGTLEALAGTAGGLLILEKVLRRLLGLGGATATGRVLGLGGRALGGLGRGGVIGGALGVLGLIKSDDPETKSSLQKTLGPLFYELGLSKSPDLTGGGSSSAATAEKVQRAVNKLVDAGYPIESAIGIVSGLYSESGLNENAVNPTSGAKGIGQWLGSRKNGSGSTFDEQLQHVIDELASSERATGDRLKKGGLNSREALGTFIHGFERPGAGEAGDLARGGPLADLLSSQIAQQNSSTKNVNVTSNATINISGAPDAHSTAKQYTDAHNDVHDNLVGNLVPAVR